MAPTHASAITGYSWASQRAETLPVSVSSTVMLPSAQPSHSMRDCASTTERTPTGMRIAHSWRPSSVYLTMAPCLNTTTMPLMVSDATRGVGTIAFIFPWSRRDTAPVPEVGNVSIGASRCSCFLSPKSLAARLASLPAMRTLFSTFSPTTDQSFPSASSMSSRLVRGCTTRGTPGTLSDTDCCSPSSGATNSAASSLFFAASTSAFPPVPLMMPMQSIV
mmetsp:Transcript_14449/g.42102  ORF Transcript_14449/g.42102 Transcript_14449/m.42102 type:complete len:220 (-) Transcript_14449:2369-3028(-)